MIDKDGADHIIAVCNLKISRKSEIYESLTRPKNDSYANGEYSGYIHAMKDIISEMKHIKLAIDVSGRW